MIFLNLEKTLNDDEAMDVVSCSTVSPFLNVTGIKKMIKKKKSKPKKKAGRRRSGFTILVVYFQSGFDVKMSLCGIVKVVSLLNPLFYLPGLTKHLL